MSSIASGAGSVVGGQAGGYGGMFNNAIDPLLGLGQQNPYYQAGNIEDTPYGQGISNLNELQGMATKEQEGLNSNNIQNQLNMVASGQQSVQDLMNNPNFSGDAKNAMMKYMGVDPRTATQFATGQVQDNAITGQLFGQGGTFNQANQKLQGLYNQGYQLTPEDMTMYGQASGNIARQFGQQGNQASSDLASRGLSSSGAAGATFSGLAGNQNEQLAQAQQQIMQQRFTNTQNQINSLQTFAGTLGAQGEQDIQSQYARNVGGVEAENAARNQAAGLAGQQAGLGTNAYSAQQQALQDQQKSQNENKMPTFTGMIGSGVAGLFGATGSSAGKGIGGNLGGGGSSGAAAAAG